MQIDLDNLDSNGFTIKGITGSGAFNFDLVSFGGDVNGDGVDDFLLLNSGGQPGSAYVIFGGDALNSAVGDGVLDLQAELDGLTGVAISGTSISFAEGTSIPSVSGIGDINADGFDDFAVTGNGETYIVYGTGGDFELDPFIDLDILQLNSRTGFFTIGDAPSAISGAGDVNGDGVDDFVIGDDGNEAAYVVFGDADGFDINFDLTQLDGTNVFTFTSPQSADAGVGFSVASADVNGDGFSAAVIGANSFDVDPGDPNSLNTGAAYVVYGSDAGFPETFDAADLDGTNGTVILGAEGGDQLGFEVSSAGDVNGDGIEDIIVSAPNRRAARHR